MEPLVVLPVCDLAEEAQLVPPLVVGPQRRDLQRPGMQGAPGPRLLAVVAVVAVELGAALRVGRRQALAL
jgi:hypothetical protein